MASTRVGGIVEVMLRHLPGIEGAVVMGGQEFQQS